LTAVFQPAADDDLRLAADMAGRPARIAVGRVDGVEAGVDESVEDSGGGGLVDVPAEHVAAEHQRRDGQAGAAERAEVHAMVLPSPSPGGGGSPRRSAERAG